MSQNVEIVRGLYLPGDTDLVGVFGDDAQANAIAGLLASLADADYEFIDHDMPDLAGGAPASTGSLLPGAGSSMTGTASISPRWNSSSPKTKSWSSRACVARARVSRSHSRAIERQSGRYATAGSCV